MARDNISLLKSQSKPRTTLLLTYPHNHPMLIAMLNRMHTTFSLVSPLNLTALIIFEVVRLR